ncbi:MULTISPECIES: C4-dicarboxylate transporter DcuC [Enterococcus]|uniref:C4-dicarboxylate transporter DcuC n=1 Tax=Enterococcus TaxID=1350 RepID=UPI0008C22ACD|nr:MULTISPECIES: C4-dicarboxylate transporter DcuC [Enterococcus]SES76241.1 C4-dicarboxylate transporter, DcuC family [Enterococcus malodoratus]HCM87222.1 C4-dicarboxylate ABC transporter [Enterococcus sp.]
MNVVLTCVVGILAVGILVYMLLKKNDIKMTLLILGVVLMYIALLMGRKLEISETTGALLLDPFQVIVDQFTNTLVGPGFVILILGGYSAYMNHIGANKVTVQALTKPIAKIKSIYILIPIVFLIGNLLSLVIPSASNLAIILLATLYPVLRTAGMSRLSAAAIIGTSATIVPTPLGSDNVAIASLLNINVTDYVFKSHAIVSIPTLLAIALVHYFWQKREDTKQKETLSYAEEIAANDPAETKVDTQTSYSGIQAFVYGILPLLPIILLLIVFVLNIVLGTTLNISVQVVSLISFIIAVLVEFMTRRSVNSVLKETSYFFDGMGGVMSIVALLVSAQVFVQGLTSIGIIELVQKTMENISGAGILLPVIMVAFTAVIVLLSGSGTALLFAMIPLMIPLSKAAGIDPIALSIPMQLSGNLLRAVSPVAAVILIVAGTTKLSPMQIVRRTSVPMIFGVVLSLVLSLILFQ